MNKIIETKRFSFLAELSNMRSAIMGIAILWIMLFHSGLQCPDNTILKALWYVFVSFGGGVGVNIFFILSGFGLYYSVAKYDDQQKIRWWGWYKKRFIRIIPSYLIIAVVFYLMKHDLTLYNLLQLNFWLDGARDFWFIPGILLCYVLFPPMYVLAKRLGFTATTACVLALLLLQCELIGLFVPGYYDKIEILLWRLPCFVIGVYMGYLSKEQVCFNYWLVYILIFVLLVGCWWVQIIGQMRLLFLLGTLLFLPPLLGLSYLIKKSVPLLQSVFDYLGKRSLQVYLTHVSIVLLILAGLENMYLWWSLYFAVTLLISEMVYRVTLPNLFVRKK